MRPMIRKSSLIGVLLVLMLTVTHALTFAQDKPACKVEIDPANFVAVIDNSYYPHIPGTSWVYEGQTADGMEHVEIQVLTDTHDVMGVKTTVVRDTVYLDGVVHEDTYDYFAQDKDGNVWYFGEDVSDFEKGKLSSKTGSWEAGVDGALPGIVMFGDPAAHLSETYLQEYYKGQAEDSATMLSVTGLASVPYGDFDNLVMTYDYTPLNTKSHEFKYYAKGIGEIKSIDLTTGDVETLVKFTAP